MCSVVNILCVREVFCHPISQVGRKASVPEVVLFTLLYTRGVSAIRACTKTTCNPNPRTATLLHNGDKYSHCTAAQKGAGLGQGNKACIAQGFDRTLLELGGKNVKPTAECSKASLLL